MENQYEELEAQWYEANRYNREVDEDEADWWDETALERERWILAQQGKQLNERDHRELLEQHWLLHACYKREIWIYNQVGTPPPRRQELVKEWWEITSGKREAWIQGQLQKENCK